VNQAVASDLAPPRGAIIALGTLFADLVPPRGAIFALGAISPI